MSYNSNSTETDTITLDATVTQDIDLDVTTTNKDVDISKSEHYDKTVIVVDAPKYSKVDLITQVSPLKAPSPGSAGFQPCSGSTGASRKINGLASS